MIGEHAGCDNPHCRAGRLNGGSGNDDVYGNGGQDKLRGSGGSDTCATLTV